MRLADLTTERLRDVAPELSEEQHDCLAELAREHAAPGFGGEASAFVVPGRIELLGKHTDYAGGRSLTCATEQGFCLVASPRDDRTLRVRDLERDKSAVVDLDPELVVDAGDWVRYVQAVARRLARDFGDEVRGAEVTLASSLPRASGMSSSSALVVSLFYGLAAAGEMRARVRESVGDSESLAEYLGAIESGRAFGALEEDQGVGTLGGSEDHTAILCSHADHAGLFSYAPVRREQSIAVPAGYRFVVAASGVRAKKAGDAQAAYNRASLGAAAAAKLWRERTGGDEPHLAAVLRSGPEAHDRLLEIVAEGGDGFSGDELRQRVDHFHQESELLLPQAAEALADGDRTLFGLLVDRSQHLAHRLLGNQVAETAALAEIAREMGAEAASSFGAGFGGAVWALVAEDEADDFAASWLDDYLDSFPQHEDDALALITAAGPAALELTDDGPKPWF